MCSATVEDVIRAARNLILPACAYPADNIFLAKFYSEPDERMKKNVARNVGNETKETSFIKPGENDREILFIGFLARKWTVL